MASVVPAFNFKLKKLEDGSVIDINTGEVITGGEPPATPTPEDKILKAIEDEHSPIKKLADGTVIDFESELVLTSAPRDNELVGGVELTLCSREWVSLFNSIAAVEYFHQREQRWVTKMLTVDAKSVYSAILRLYEMQGDDMQTIVLNSSTIVRECGVTLSKIVGCINILKATQLIAFDRISRGYFIYLYRPSAFLQVCTPLVQSLDDVDEQYVRSRYGKCTEGEELRKVV